HQWVPVAVVVADDQERPALRKRVEALDAQPAPEGDGPVEGHGDSVGAGSLAHRGHDFYALARFLVQRPAPRTAGEANRLASNANRQSTGRDDDERRSKADGDRGRRTGARLQERAAGGRRDRPGSRAG